MNVVSNRNIQIQFSGDIDFNFIQSALQNDNSPGQVFPLTLDPGITQLIVEQVSPITCVGVTIVPPAGNVIPITLKGDPADVGILLHLTDPTTIAIGDPLAIIYLSIDPLGPQLVNIMIVLT